MNKARISTIVALVAILVASWFISQSPASAQAVPIPIEINLWVEGLVFAAVTAGFVWLFKTIGLDLRGFTAQISGALSVWILFELQDLINTIPDTYDVYVSIVFKIIVVVLGGLGSLFILARANRSEALLE
jgi:hypothetical protein